MKMGEMIRTLRRKAGKTQEALAEALGMSTQAVSRWESGGGYPDVELIPRIANYFHVSIDELFGYDGDKQKRIDEILCLADMEINQTTVTEECITTLREALLEFPQEEKLLLRLGYALTLFGSKNYGARRYRTDTGNLTNDIAYNAQNPYFREAVSILEKVLTLHPSAEDRTHILSRLILLYGWMGETERAETLAASCDSVYANRERMFALAADGTYRTPACGNELLAMADVFAEALQRAIQISSDVDSTYIADILLQYVCVYESLFAEGECGEHHLTLSRLYLSIAGHTENTSYALEMFDKAYHHALAYEKVRNQTVFNYRGPLIEGAQKTVYSKWPRFHLGLLAGYRRGLSDTLLEQIDNDSRYAALRETTL